MRFGHFSLNGPNETALQVSLCHASTFSPQVTTLSLFLRLLAAHICGDVLFNGPFLAGAKRSHAPGKRVQFIGIHCLIHAVCILFWLWPFGRQVKIWACIYVFTVHFLIDYARTTFEMRAVPEGQLRVVKRRQALLYLIGGADAETNIFLGKHLKVWLGSALVDQGLHAASIGLFALGLGWMGWV